MCHNKPFLLLSGKLNANYVSPPMALNSILHGWNTADGAQEGKKKKTNHQKLKPIKKQINCVILQIKKNEHWWCLVVWLIFNSCMLRPTATKL